MLFRSLSSCNFSSSYHPGSRSELYSKRLNSFYNLLQNDVELGMVDKIIYKKWEVVSCYRIFEWRMPRMEAHALVCTWQWETAKRKVQKKKEKKWAFTRFVQRWRFRVRVMVSVHRATCMVQQNELQAQAFFYLCSRKFFPTFLSSPSVSLTSCK